MAPPNEYPDESRSRAVRLYRESDPKPVIWRLAEQLGVHHEALRNWIRRTRPTADSVTTGPRPPSPRSCAGSARRTRNSIAPTRSSSRRPLPGGGTRPDPETVVKLVEQLRGRFGVEFVLGVLGVASPPTTVGWPDRPTRPAVRARTRE
ncbi:transposase [Saccharothrix isguenensis]